MGRTARRLPSLALSTLAFLPAAPRATQDDVCPWCENDPARLAASGALSHGPFPIGPGTTAELAEALPADWLFLETAHLRIATSLGPAAITRADRQELAPYLARLAAAFPEAAKVRKLDPHLRLHLYALRCEDFYARFQRLLGVEDADFPESRQATGPFMGNGRFLGEKEKYELVLHASTSTHRQFTNGFAGAAVTDAVRWHFSPAHKLLASIPCEDMKRERFVFAHSVHIMSHLFLCGYKHFSYDPPVWLDEGLAHFMEREVEPSSTTIDGDEGAGPRHGGNEDWTGEDVKLVRRGKQPRLAEVMRFTAFHDLDDDSHVAVWSMVRFLVDEYPEGLARLLGGVSGQLDAKGFPTGIDLPGLQRRLLREIWDWSPAGFDDAWAEWVLAQTRTP